MIENHTAGYKRKKRRYNLLTSDGPFPSNQNILQFYSGAGRGELLECLVRHVQNCDEPVLITGEPGSGKTLLSLVLADRLKKKFSVCRYDFPTLNSDALISFLIREIKPDYATVNGRPAKYEQESNLAALAFVVDQSAEIVQPFLVIIDTPAKFDSDVLRTIEELKTLKLNGHALFNVVIFRTDHGNQNLSGAQSDWRSGLPEMRQQMRPESGLESQLELQSELQAESRTEAKLTTAPNLNLGPEPDQAQPWPYKTHNLGRLSLPEIHDYLQHHMMLFDYSQRNMFSREMSYFIADRSEGVYGLINELARSAFLLAGINNSSQVSLSHLVAVSSPRRSRSRRIGKLRRMPNGVRFAIIVAGIVVLGAAAIVLSAN